MSVYVCVAAFLWLSDDVPRSGKHAEPATPASVTDSPGIINGKFILPSDSSSDDVDASKLPESKVAADTFIDDDTDSDEYLDEFINDSEPWVRIARVGRDPYTPAGTGMRQRRRPMRYSTGGVQGAS